MPDAAQDGEALLELVHLGSHDVLPVIQNPGNRAVDCRANPVLLGFEVNEFDAHASPLPLSLDGLEPAICGLLVAATGFRTDEIGGQPQASRANPADTARREPSHQSVSRNIRCDDGPSGNKAEFTKRIAANNRRVGADRRAPFHERTCELRFAFDLSPRIVHIRKDATGPAEDPILKLHAIIQADIVLDLAVVSNRDAGSHHDILTQRAMLSYLAVLEDMDEVPNPGPLADAARLIDIRALMNEDVVRPGNHSCTWNYR